MTFSAAHRQSLRVGMRAGLAASKAPPPPDEKEIDELGGAAAIQKLKDICRRALVAEK